jgi:hypothetical protein
MPVREIAAKTTAFGLVAAGLIVAGVFVIYGPHPANEGIQNIVAGGALILFGLAVGGIGSLSILGIVHDTRVRRREAMLEITPRPGNPAPPPAWGMGDIGRPGSGVVTVGDAPHGGGVVKAVSFRVSNADAPLLIVYLLVWTLVGLIDPFYLWFLAAATLVIGGALVTLALLRPRR